MICLVVEKSENFLLSTIDMQPKCAPKYMLLILEAIYGIKK